jgi:hypothetical protein
VNSHPSTEPLRNDCVCHYVRAKLLRCQTLPPLVSRGIAFGRRFQSTTFNTAVFDSVVRYGRTIVRINAKPVAFKHTAPSAPTTAILLPRPTDPLTGCGKTRSRLIMLSRFGDYVAKGRVLVASAAA